MDIGFVGFRFVVWKVYDGQQPRELGGNVESNENCDAAAFRTPGSIAYLAILEATPPCRRVPAGG